MIPKYLLTYKFHLYTINFTEKEVQDRCETYEKFEDLLADYRKKKNALFANCINYNTDFKVYTLQATEQNISKLDALL
jgi:hypothetical protein